MLFPSKIIIALLLSVVYIFVCFSLRLPDTYKKIFLSYSVIISILFLAFLLYFSMDSRLSGFPEFGYSLDGLAFFYYLIVIPLLIALIGLIWTWVIKLTDYSLITRSVVILSPSLLLIGLGFLGFYPFLFTFYGFAP